MGVLPATMLEAWSPPALDRCFRSTGMPRPEQVLHEHDIFLYCVVTRS